MKKVFVFLAAALSLVLLGSPAMSQTVQPMIFSVCIGSYQKTGQVPPDFKAERREVIPATNGQLVYLDIFSKGRPLPCLNVGEMQIRHVRDGKASISQVYMDFREIFYSPGIHTMPPANALLPMIKPALWLDATYNGELGFLRYNVGASGGNIRGAFPLKKGEVAIIWSPSDNRFWQTFLIEVSESVGKCR